MDIDGEAKKESHTAGDRRISLGIPGVRVSFGCFIVGVIVMLFAGYFALTAAAHWWGLQLPHEITPFDTHPPRTAPLKRALSSADRLEVIEVRVRDGAAEPVTSPTIIIEDDVAAVQDFIKGIQFVESPDVIALTCVPSHVLEFYNGDKLLEKVYLINGSEMFLNWIGRRWFGGTSELTPESSNRLRRWLESRRVELEPEGGGCD